MPATDDDDDDDDDGDDDEDGAMMKMMMMSINDDGVDNDGDDDDDDDKNLLNLQRTVVITDFLESSSKAKCILSRVLNEPKAHRCRRELWPYLLGKT